MLEAEAAGATRRQVILNDGRVVIQAGGSASGTTGNVWGDVASMIFEGFRQDLPVLCRVWN